MGSGQIAFEIKMPINFDGTHNNKKWQGRLPFLPKPIGGWWQANEEIDIVLLSETHTIR